VIELVENALLDDQHTRKHSRVPSSDAQSPNLNGSQSMLAPFVGALGSLTNELRALSATISSTSAEETLYKDGIERARSKKRRLSHDSTIGSRWISEPQGTDLLSGQNQINTAEQEAIGAYFRFIQPWISIVHEPSFLNEVREPASRSHLQVLVQAMLLATSNFKETRDQSQDPEVTSKHVTDRRHSVLASIMGDVRVVNVQALLILVFADIADDKVETAYSLLGIAWRQIETLKNVENSRTHDGKSDNQNDANVWIDAEEQRRVFWNAFMLDRLCAALLGRNPTFLNITTSSRLPACGSYWYTNQPRLTPRLPLSDSSKGGLHHPFITSAREKMANSPQEDSGLGALAFYAESVESLSVILSHFLSLQVNYTNSNEVSHWLMRFRDLDQQLML